MCFGQKNHDETFKRPEWYEQMAITGAGTHDMPTFAGWWKALDLKLSRKHGMISTDEAYNNDANYRLWERKRVLWILSDTGISVITSYSIHYTKLYDLGTVPQGTKEKMEDYDILCMRMFFGQKNHDETFKRPEWYEQMAITSYNFV